MKRFLGTGLVLVALAAAAGAAKGGSGFDDGRLELSWFGGGDLELREADEIDYLWVKPGFSVDGRTLHFVDWPEPKLLGPQAGERDANDQRLARQMSGEMAQLLEDVFARELGGKAKVSRSGGDVRVEGRVVDASTGSTAAKMLVGFGAGSGNVTIDLKMIDAGSGELLAALHHRVVSGTTWSTSDSKFVNWTEDVAREIARKGLATMYEKGKRVRD